MSESIEKVDLGCLFFWGGGVAHVCARKAAGGTRRCLNPNLDLPQHGAELRAQAQHAFFGWLCVCFFVCVLGVWCDVRCAAASAHTPRTRTRRKLVGERALRVCVCVMCVVGEREGGVRVCKLCT